jgi:hypothetical protein
MLIQYIRDPKTRQRRGVVVAVARETDFGVGWSLCHTKRGGKGLDRFDRDRGLQIALARATKYGRMWYQSKVPHSIYSDVDEMAARAGEYFKQFSNKD